MREQLPGGILLRPAGEFFGDVVEDQHAAFVVRRDEAVADRAQGHGEAFLFRGEIFLEAFALDLGAGARGENLQRGFDDLHRLELAMVEYAHHADRLGEMIDEGHGDKGVDLQADQQTVLGEARAGAAEVGAEAVLEHLSAGAARELEWPARVHRSFLRERQGARHAQLFAVQLDDEGVVGLQSPRQFLDERFQKLDAGGRRDAEPNVAQRILAPQPLSDIAHDEHETFRVPFVQGAHRKLHRKGLLPRPLRHRRSRAADELGEIFAEGSLRDVSRDILAAKLRRSLAEHLRRGWIGGLDHAFGVDRDDAIERGLHDRARWDLADFAMKGPPQPGVQRTSAGEREQHRGAAEQPEVRFAGGYFVAAGLVQTPAGGGEGDVPRVVNGERGRRTAKLALGDLRFGEILIPGGDLRREAL